MLSTQVRGEQWLIPPFAALTSDRLSPQLRRLTVAIRNDRQAVRFAQIAALADGSTAHRKSARTALRRWIHEMACPEPNVLFVAELLNWRVQKLLLAG